MSVLGSKREASGGGGFAIGIAIGVALGVAMDNIGAGIAIGVAIGVTWGATQRRRTSNADHPDQDASSE